MNKGNFFDLEDRCEGQASLTKPCHIGLQALRLWDKSSIEGLWRQYRVVRMLFLPQGGLYLPGCKQEITP